jgi:hypothetical protein
LRTAVLVLVVAAVALGLVAVVGKVFGVFDGFGFVSAASSSVQAAASVSAEAAAELDPAPALGCAGSTEGGAVDSAATAKGEDTPRAAAEGWFATVHNHDRLGESRQYAAPAGAPQGARVIAWFDQDGVAQAEATVVPAPGGGWLLQSTASCT